MGARKPPKLFYSPLTESVYVSFAYRELKDNPHLFVITGNKYDVTEQVEIMAQNLGYTKSRGTV